MTDAGINDLLFEQAKKLAEKKAFSNKVYTDEPLLFTASRLIAEEEAPEEYRELIKLSSDPRFGASDSARFYAQAKLMENFNGDEDFIFRGTYSAIRPSYKTMTTDQLRGYFSWRTHVRKGDIKKTVYGFVVTYISELLNLIGVKDADEGFTKLTDFLKVYSGFDGYILFQGLSWAKNFAIYYAIDPQRYKDFAAAIRPESISSPGEDNICVIIDYKNHSKNEVVEALFALSTYNITKSKWYKQNTDEVYDTVYRVYLALHEKYDGAKIGLINLLFPFMKESTYKINSNSLFYHKEVHEDCVYALSPIEVYRCTGGVWTCTGMALYSKDYTSPDIGILLKAIDCVARKMHGIVPELLKPPIRETWNKLIISEFKSYLLEQEYIKKEKQRKSVKIDRSLLAGIRSDSDDTREKLMTDDERGEEETEPENHVDELSPAEEKKNPFSPLQTEFLSVILSGGNLKAFAKSNGCFVSGLADEINEITLELLGDTAVDCDGSSAEIIEDYINDIKELAGL